MTPAQIIALVRDVLIIGALAFIVWWIHSAAETSVKLADLQAVQKQLANNAQTVAQWHQESIDAANQRSLEMGQVSATIAANNHPVFLQPTASCPHPVPVAATAASSQPASSGGPDEGRGVDLRPRINGFELKYEKALADCRAVLSQWPQ